MMNSKNVEISYLASLRLIQMVKAKGMLTFSSQLRRKLKKQFKN